MDESTPKSIKLVISSEAEDAPRRTGNLKACKEKEKIPHGACTEPFTIVQDRLRECVRDMDSSVATLLRNDIEKALIRVDS